jgi:hypothetical protein
VQIIFPHRGFHIEQSIRSSPKYMQAHFISLFRINLCHFTICSWLCLSGKKFLKPGCQWRVGWDAKKSPRRLLTGWSRMVFLNGREGSSFSPSPRVFATNIAFLYIMACFWMQSTFGFHCPCKLRIEKLQFWSSI